MTKPDISEDDLQAYVDGCLPQSRRAAVEAWLRDHPRDAERIADYGRQNESLRGIYDAVLAEPVTAALASAAGSPPRLAIWRHVAVLAWLALGGLVGWQLRGMETDHERSGMTFARHAAIAHVVYSPEIRHPVEVGADQEAHLVAWLSKRLGTPLQVPHLGEQGYTLVGGRLLPGLSDQRTPVAQFMYQDAKGQRLTLYVRTDANPSRETAFRFARENNVSVFYWVDQKLGYALSGDIEKNELLRVAHAIYRRLNP